MTQKQSELVGVKMATICKALNLRAGGQEALCAMALITGGDYDTEGLAQVGKTGAMRVISHLLKGRQASMHMNLRSMDLVIFSGIGKCTTPVIR